jgi:tRNA (adenine58-N1)-methyltransferase non-catalytic subunit
MSETAAEPEKTATTVSSAMDKSADSAIAKVSTNGDPRTTTTIAVNSNDPLLKQPSNVVREGDFVILVFGDGRQLFAHCVKKAGGKSRLAPVRISKNSYPTANLIGLPYGTVLELGDKLLLPLPPTEGLMPDFLLKQDSDDDDGASDDRDSGMADGSIGLSSISQSRDNRHLVDTNTSQALDQRELARLRRSGATGSTIVQHIVDNSSTFATKTDFSKAKYIARKQIKYQQRCRLLRCTGVSICEALYLKDPRKIMNLREDTLAQILSYSNISAGCQTLVLETCMGIVTGAIAQRMGGYGKVLSIYSGQQPSFNEMMQRFNLSFCENFSVKWLHSGDVFGDDIGSSVPDAHDPEKADRDALKWPCPLQAHTRSYLENMRNDKERASFLAKRSARFARKLMRQTPAECKEWLTTRKSDSVIVVARYDPTVTLLGMLPYLAPSSPFVVYCEFIEPLTECFRELQRQDLAINLRLSDTWTREYQVLPGRTHPNMNMSQSGGFILTGIKIDEETGHNELDVDLLKEIRESIGGRRGRRPKQKDDEETAETARGKKGRDAPSSPAGSRESKRLRSVN